MTNIYEPQIIDYYNEYPSFVTIIDNLNKEFQIILEENVKLKKEIENTNLIPSILYKKNQLNGLKKKKMTDLLSIIN